MLLVFLQTTPSFIHLKDGVVLFNKGCLTLSHYPKGGV